MNCRRAFSLIELLVVVAIIGILTSLAVPSISTLLKANAIASAEEQIVAEISHARMAAIASNRETEVRFLRFSDPELPGSDPRVRAVQSFRYQPDGTPEPLGKMRKLPGRIIADPGLSTLLAEARKKDWGTETQPAIPGVGKNYEAFAFRFRPSGLADLDPYPQEPWCVTVHDGTKGEGLSAAPPNYVAFVIDPINGHVTRFRP